MGELMWWLLKNSVKLVAFAYAALLLFYSAAILYLHLTN